MNGEYVKYPRTFHFPWSDGITPSERVHTSTEQFEGKNVVVTRKMDGENTTMYYDYIHSRSIMTRYHPSRDWVKRFHSTIKREIPKGWRICGENLYAKHSILYKKLVSYFLGFSIWNENNVCLSWKETLEWFTLLGILPVSVIYDGVWNETVIRKFDDEDRRHHEGYVVRIADSFHYDDFTKFVGKYVRKNHIQTDQHWTRGKIVPNKMKG